MRGTRLLVLLTSIILLLVLVPDASAFYHPQAGRWIQRDPEGYVDGMSLYEYVQSGPLVFVDPKGLTVTLTLALARWTPAALGVMHCGIEICWGGDRVERYEITDAPNLDEGGRAPISLRTSLFLGGSIGSGTGSATGAASTASSSAPASASASATSSGSAAGASAGASVTGFDMVMVGPTFSARRAEGVTSSYTIEAGHAQNDRYKRWAEAGMPMGEEFDLFSNNCCHWASRVIQAAGGTWPIETSINWGMNPGTGPTRAERARDAAVAAVNAVADTTVSATSEVSGAIRSTVATVAERTDVTSWGPPMTYPTDDKPRAGGIGFSIRLD